MRFIVNSGIGSQTPCFSAQKRKSSNSMAKLAAATAYDSTDELRPIGLYQKNKERNCLSC